MKRNENSRIIRTESGLPVFIIYVHIEISINFPGSDHEECYRWPGILGYGLRRLLFQWLFAGPTFPAILIEVILFFYGIPLKQGA